MLKKIVFYFIFFGFYLFSQKINISIKNAEIRIPEDKIAMAGVSFRNITPHWGLYTAGHSIFASKSKGIHTKLKVRAIYIQDKENNAISLVLTDALASEPYLNHKVAELVNKETGLTSAQIILSSTHTHKSYFNYSHSQIVNSNVSGRKGFDKNFFNFLATQTAEAIIEAYNNKKPAKISNGSTQINGFSRNRQLKTYSTNFPKGKIDYKNPLSTVEAVNKSFNMIRIDVQSSDKKYYPLATFCNFGVHGTAVSEKSELWGGDWFAIAHSYLDSKIKELYKTPWQPINSIAAGTEGDVEINQNYYKTGSILGAKQTNYDSINFKTEKLSEQVLLLFKSLDNKLTSDFSIKWALEEKNILDEHTINGISIGKKPMVGFSVAGAPENNSGLKIFAGPNNLLTKKWFFNNKYQGKKRPIGAFSGIIHNFFVGSSKKFPSFTMFQLVKIGNIVLVPLPFEVTTFSGYQIQDSLAVKLKIEKENINILSAANGYNGYLSTPKEYQTQDYSEGQTWFGLNSLPFVIANLNLTAKRLITSQNPVKYYRKYNFYVKKMADKFSFSPAIHKEFSIKRKELRPPYYFKGKETRLEIFQQAYRFEWSDVAYNKIQWEDDLVEVQQSIDKINWETVRDKNGLLVKDDGYYNLYINVIDKKPKLDQDNISYRSSWINPSLELNTYYRFAIKSRGNLPELHSTIFFK